MLYFYYYNLLLWVMGCYQSKKIIVENKIENEKNIIENNIIHNNINNNIICNPLNNDNYNKNEIIHYPVNIVLNKENIITFVNNNNNNNNKINDVSISMEDVHHSLANINNSNLYSVHDNINNNVNIKNNKSPTKQHIINLSFDDLAKEISNSDIDSNVISYNNNNNNNNKNERKYIDDLNSLNDTLLFQNEQKDTINLNENPLNRIFNTIKNDHNRNNIIDNKIITTNINNNNEHIDGNKTDNNNDKINNKHNNSHKNNDNNKSEDDDEDDDDDVDLDDSEVCDWEDEKDETFVENIRKNTINPSIILNPNHIINNLPSNTSEKETDPAKLSHLSPLNDLKINKINSSPERTPNAPIQRLQNHSIPILIPNNNHSPIKITPPPPQHSPPHHSILLSGIRKINAIDAIHGGIHNKKINYTQGLHNIPNQKTHSNTLPIKNTFLHDPSLSSDHINHIKDNSIVDTNIVKRKKAQLPQGNLPHPTPKFGDWLNSRTMINNYIIIDSLGSGSYADVKLCKEKQTDRLFAMKIINRDIMKTNSLSNHKKNVNNNNNNKLDDIKKEIAIMKKLNHPNVLKLYEVMDDPNINKLYLVLEYMKKGDLLSLQKSKSIDGSCEPMDERELHVVTLQLLLGLTYLHDQKVVHGDIKPQNLLVSETGIVKIADFGISQSLYGSKQKLMDTAGTPAFMSPEICSGKEYSGQQADVWAVGATIYMLKYGFPPFVASNALQIFEKIQFEPLHFPIGISIDPSLKELLQNMLNKDSNKRFTLLETMKHPWVTKDTNLIKQSIIPYDTITVSKEEILCAIHGSDKFALLVNVRIQMLKRLQKARKKIIERKNSIKFNTLSDTTNLQIYDSTKMIQKIDISATFDNMTKENNTMIEQNIDKNRLSPQNNPISSSITHNMLTTEETIYRSKVFARKKNNSDLYEKINKENNIINDLNPQEEIEDDNDLDTIPDIIEDPILTTLFMNPNNNRQPSTVITFNIAEENILMNTNVSKEGQNNLLFSNIHSNVTFGGFSTQGRRSSQEDRCIIIPDFSVECINNKNNIFYNYNHMNIVLICPSLKPCNYSFCAIYDGHGGVRSTELLLNLLHLKIINSIYFPTNLIKSIEIACHDMDEYICDKLLNESDYSGSTAIFLIYINDPKYEFNKLIIGNIGDCRAIMSQKDTHDFIILSKDHRPSLREDECKRIVSNGGKIINNRINGVLAITRSFGDLEFKGIKNYQSIEYPNHINVPKQIEIGTLITSEPEITMIEINKKSNDFIVLACDGLWDVMKNEEVILFVKEKLKIHNNIQMATQELVQEAIKRFSNDNITVIIMKYCPN